jgi:hypothetical protein
MSSEPKQYSMPDTWVPTEERSERSSVPLPAALLFPTKTNGVVIGRLVALVENEPHVQFAGNPDAEPQIARTITPLMHSQVGSEVVLLFEEGNLRHPIIMGCLVQANTPTVEVRYQNGKLTLAADREIVLKTGDSSITLTAAGKVLINGAYVQTKSSGVNRIKGASVQIN